jgi:hypothetical protein
MVREVTRLRRRPLSEGKDQSPQHRRTRWPVDHLMKPISRDQIPSKR